MTAWKASPSEPVQFDTTRRSPDASPGGGVGSPPPLSPPPQLGQRPGHRRPADPVPLAQLVLGGKPPVRPVAAIQDLLEQQRLELEVDRYGQLGIDGHGSPLAKTVPPGVGSAAIRAQSWVQLLQQHEDSTYGNWLYATKRGERPRSLAVRRVCTPEPPPTRSPSGAPLSIAPCAAREEEGRVTAPRADHRSGWLNLRGLARGGVPLMVEKRAGAGSR